jgi:hypothetical protein
MTKTVIGTYSDLDSAVNVVNRLVDAGFHRNSISVIANDPDEKYASYVDQSGDMDDTAKGAGFGAAIGGKTKQKIKKKAEEEKQRRKIKKK